MCRGDVYYIKWIRLIEEKALETGDGRVTALKSPLFPTADRGAHP
jgi:hypothetical protein